MSSFYIENLYNIIHTENITIIYTYAKNLPKSHEFEAVEGKNGYTQRFYQQSLDARACARYAFSEYNEYLLVSRPLLLPKKADRAF